MAGLAARLRGVRSIDGFARFWRVKVERLRSDLLRRIASLGPEGGPLSHVTTTDPAYWGTLELIGRGLVQCVPGGRVRITGSGLDVLAARTEVPS